MHELSRSFRAHLDKSLFKSLGAAIPELEARFGEAYLDDFEAHLELLGRAFPERPWPAWAVQGFVRFNKEILREESQFRESGEYSAKAEDFDRIVEDTYDNADVMDRFYLVGLYCSYFIWPHHYDILTFFREAFLSGAGAEPERLAEWGVGHGLFSALALKRWPRAQAELCDISRHSLNFSEALLRASGALDRCRMLLADVTSGELPQPVDRLICGELLEHTPEPQLLLDRIRQSLRPGGIAYLTGAVNAPQSDHVSLFRSGEELTSLVEGRGFRIRQQVSLCHPNRMAEQNPPTVVAMVIESNT